MKTNVTFFKYIYVFNSMHSIINNLEEQLDLENKDYVTHKVAIVLYARENDVKMK